MYKHLNCAVHIFSYILQFSKIYSSPKHKPVFENISNILFQPLKAPVMIMHTAAMNASYSEYSTATYTTASLFMESPLSTNYVPTHGPIQSLTFIPRLDWEAISAYDSKRADDKQPVPVMQPRFYDHTPSSSANSEPGLSQPPLPSAKPWPSAAAIPSEEVTRRRESIKAAFKVGQ